jgi:transketolase
VTGPARTGLDSTGLAATIRRDVVGMAGSATGAHVGGSLSCADILAVLYGGLLRLDGPDPDTFVLSKGHAAPALYSALAARGIIDPAELATFAAPGSRLFGHPPRGLPGVTFPTGSLGHGLALGAGLALAARLTGSPSRTVVLLGDGELQEGSVWESLMFAGHRGLTALVAVVDRNRLQISGPTERSVGLDPLDRKLDAFGWEARVVDGHDHRALHESIATPADRPVAVVADTVKGRGVPFLEGRVAGHYATFTGALTRRALHALDAGSRS